MKKIKYISEFLFGCTILSLPVSFALTCLIGEVRIFGVGGIVRYSWIMLCFLPITLLSLLFGWILKKRGEKYKKHLIVALVCTSLLLLFGVYRVAIPAFSYDIDQMDAIEKTMHVDLPDNVKIATEDLDKYTVSYVKMLDQGEISDFHVELESNELWTSKLSPAIKGILPLSIQAEIYAFDYFLFYNLTSNEYNLLPENDQNECIFIAYDCEMSRFIIVSRYKVDVN